MCVFVVALVGGYLIGQMPQWQLHLPQNLPLRMIAGNINGYTGYFFGGNPALAIAWQNGRILLGATLLAMFTFGAARADPDASGLRRSSATSSARSCWRAITRRS